ncbi:MAG: hypothetical protein CMA63_06850 [Euryarchaeota archaeon]|nr:hypothetical protein [Euryarchaeota archaeon]
MPFEYTNRARNTGTGAFVYWVTQTSADPTMTASNAPNSASHTQSVVVARRQVDSPSSTQDPNLCISVSSRHILVDAVPPLQVTSAPTRVQ